MSKAFFYKNKYYLLPEEFESVTDFVNSLDKKKPTALTLLDEYNCLAPYFIKEDTREVREVLTDTEEIYPAEVEVLSAEEYEQALKEVTEKLCKGCMRYDEGDVEPYRDEITLNGICFERCEKEADSYVLHEGAEISAYLFGERKDELEKLIDNGRREEAAQIICDIISRNALPASKIFTAKKQGRYVCFCSCLMNNTMQLLMGYLFDCFSTKEFDKWVFYNYIPQGFEVCKKPNELLFKYDAVEYDRTYYDFKLKITKNTSPDEMNDMYFYLCSEVGEDRLMNVISSFEFVADEFGGFSSVVSKLNKDIDIVFAQAKIAKTSLMVPPSTVVPYAVKDNGEADGMLMTRDIEMSLALIDDQTELYDACPILKMLEIPVGVISMQMDPKDLADPSRVSAIAYNSLQTLADDRYIRILHHAVTSSGLETAFIIADPVGVMKSLRRKAPMFEHYSSKLHVTALIGEREYTINSEMNKAKQ